MREELDRKLVKKFPKIFKNRFADIRTTAMCWGFECGDGWYWLIEELCRSLQWDTNHNRHPQVVASQVKEKFGTLRFYTEGEDDRQSGMISLAYNMSATICEECGSAGTLRQDRPWVKTLCDSCAEPKVRFIGG